MTFWRSIIMLGLATLLGACAQTLKSDVARFHKLQRPTSERVMVVPLDPKKTGSLEFAEYAGVAKAYLQEIGYIPVKQNPDLIVELDYVIGDGDEKVRTRFNNVGFGTRFGVHPNFVGFGTFGPGFGGGYYGPEIDSVTVYDRQLVMNIIKASNNETLFEGRAYSRGRDNRATEIVPYLIQAMFYEFPGQSGTTEQITIELP